MTTEEDSLDIELRRDVETIERLRKLARVQDELFRIPGTGIRFGLDALVGLVPGLGDVMTTGVSAYVLVTAARLGAPASVMARLAGNILLDLLIGSVPLLGDLFDVGWKANVRNAELLERFFMDPKAVRRSSRLALAGALASVGVMVVGAAWIAVTVVTWILRQL
jgi:hypothetical protein